LRRRQKKLDEKQLLHFSFPMTADVNKGFRKAQGDCGGWLIADDRLKPGFSASPADFPFLNRPVVFDHSTQLIP
jgi:hypothetical protein